MFGSKWGSHVQGVMLVWKRRVERERVKELAEDKKGTREARAECVAWISWHLTSPCLYKPKLVLALHDTFLLQVSTFIHSFGHVVHNIQFPHPLLFKMWKQWHDFIASWLVNSGYKSIIYISLLTYKFNRQIFKYRVIH